MTAATPVRYPDLRSRPLMNRRAWWLVGMNFLIPGSAQVLAGSRRLGRFGLGSTLLFWTLVVVGVVAALIGRTSILSFLVNPIVLWAVTAVLVFYGVVWLVCTLDTLRLVRFVRLDGAVRLGTALLAVVALVVSGGAAFGGAWLSGNAAVVAAKVGSNTVDIPGGAVGPITGPVNLLLVGSDSGGGNAAYGPRGETLNDVTILVHISPKSRSVTAVSIPRDLFVGQPECTRADGSVAPAENQVKFNNALSRGGLACVASTVTQLTGLPIQYAGLIEFDGVVAMSDAVGGVPVCVATAIDDPAANLKLAAGEQTLQGAQALAFLRARKTLSGGGGDLSRISNQQVFLSALMRKVKDGSTLTDPVKLVNLANAAADSMTLSKSLAQTSTMVSIALTLKDIPLDRIAFVQYPVRATYLRGLSVALPLTDAAGALVAALKADQAVAATTLGYAAQSNPAATAPPQKGSASPSPSPTPSSAPVQLPDAVSGQSAAQQTCSKGEG